MDEEPSDHSEPASQPSEGKPESPVRLIARATTIGWDLAVPIVGGVLLGRYLDELFDKEFTWTLSLLVLGIIVAFNNLYMMYVEQRDAAQSCSQAENHHQAESQEDTDHGQ